METSKEALQILIILLPGFISLGIHTYLSPTRSLSTLDKYVLAAIFTGFNFTVYKALQLFISLFYKDVSGLRDLLSLDHRIYWPYIFSWFLVLLISIASGVFVSKLLKNKSVCAFLDRLKRS